MKKMKTSTKVIGAIVSVGVLSFAAFSVFAGGNSTTATVKTVTLAKTDLTSSVSASGTVESNTTRNVYTTQNYPVKEILVKEGDIVKAGDTLAILDMDTVLYDIQQAEINISKSQSSVTQEQKTIADGIQTSENTLTQSRISLEKQQLTYANLKQQYENGTNTELINAQTSVDTAKNNLDTYQRDMEKKQNEYETNKILYEVGAISKQELDNLETSYMDADSKYKTAQQDYDKAVRNLEITNTKLEQDLRQAEKDLANANASYNSSVTSLNQSKAKSATGVIDIEGQKVSLEKLNDQMDKAEIYAPIDGTVTKVSAIVGATPSGILFVIEDMNDLFVNVDVKEFDVSSVAVGQEAIIKTEGTKNAEIKGIVNFISPSAKDKETPTSTNVKYETHINVSEKNQGLLIGMNARTEIQLETRKDVYAVYFDSLIKNANGDRVIYVVENGIVKEIPVICGLETETKVEIIGEGLQDGLLVIASPANLTPGDQVSIEGEE